MQPTVLLFDHKRRGAHRHSRIGATVSLAVSQSTTKRDATDVVTMAKLTTLHLYGNTRHKRTRQWGRHAVVYSAGVYCCVHGVYCCVLGWCVLLCTWCVLLCTRLVCAVVYCCVLGWCVMLCTVVYSAGVYWHYVVPAGT